MQLLPSLFPALDANQVIIYVSAFFLVYFLFFTMRDIFLRTHSSLYQIACILLVGLLPVIGFLLYFLIRPARTVKERELEALLVSGGMKKKSDPRFAL